MMRRDGNLLAGKSFCGSLVAKTLLPGGAKRQREAVATTGQSQHLLRKLVTWGSGI